MHDFFKEIIDLRQLERASVIFGFGGLLQYKSRRTLTLAKLSQGFCK